MDKIQFVDTSVRDGQQSLWATNMRTETVLSVVELLDEAGFDAMEVMATSFEKKMVRELFEDPFERLRLIKQRVPDMPLRIIRGRHLAAFQITPLEIENLWYKKLADYGVGQVRSSDSSHTVSSWKKQVDLGKKYGIDTILNLIFSISPRHTDEYYAQKAVEAAKLKPFRICLKDPGALLTPERVKTLLPAVASKIGNIPLEFHTHCNTGMGVACTVEAIKLGVKIVNTAVPPMADGSSNPSVFEIVKNARTLGYEVAIDEQPLHEVSRLLYQAAKDYGMPIGTPQQYDSFHYLHQVPGGMISNLRFQLGNAGLQDKLQQVLEEIIQVRADFGYPIMVTPYSQFMGGQAVMNVISGERYKIVSDELIQYALGFWGEDESSSMDQNVRDKVLSLPRAKVLQKKKFVEPEMAELQKLYGGLGVSEDDFLLHFFTSREDVTTLRQAQSSMAGRFVGKHPLESLVRRLGQYSSIKYLRINNQDESVALAK